MFERFTITARQVVSNAQDEARQLGHRSVGTEHLLLALLHQDSGVAGTVLRGTGLSYDEVQGHILRLLGGDLLGDEDAAALSAIGIDLDAVRAKLEQTFGPGALGAVGSSGRVPFAPRAKKVIELALREAIRLRHGYIGTEHILLGLVREGQGLAARAIVEAGVTLDTLRAATLAAISAAA